MNNQDKHLPGQQLEMEVFPVKEVEVEGVQMGVLNNGNPYLTMRGLSRLCGVDSAAMTRLTSDWIEERQRPRGKKIDAILQGKGLRLTQLYWTVVSRGVEVRAFPTSVCMAILEYYAFDAEQTDKTTALTNYRKLGDSALRRLVFLSVGIDPENPQRGAWQAFQDRLQLNSQIPLGFFSVFSEMADLSLKMINTGFEFGPASVPDISVGTFWGKHWLAFGLDEKYGPRTKHPHVYPEWFPQHRAGPVDAWVYPDDALGEFRRWIQKSYLPTKFPAYLENKSRSGAIGAVDASKLLTQLKKPELPKN
ncbi:Uncharacterised protein [Serratia quinivorans]|uniref:BstA-like C-terminal domain-containing protein n=1 Tax=Serratia quinivorans TaxID=137545 RepID=A0A380ATZ7_9GAMM|nr:hypothetical protein [Serratia proteamaculans]RYM60000.1 hypothetical protein BSR03_16225 [Serratia proteamaculans]SUI86094.1 Uncharacterised protein [Serratia quinivorans]